MIKNWTHGLTLLGVGGLLALGVWAGAWAQPPGAGKAQTVQGRIERFTAAPKGEVDGAVLGDGTVIHWPPHLQDRFKSILTEGDRVKATGRMETGPAGDTHLEVQTLTNLRTNASAENDAGPPPPPPPAGPRRQPVGVGRRDADAMKVQGVVRRFMTAPLGEVDGAVLEDGTVIHWPPHLQDRFKAILAKGDHIKASGWMETGPAGDTHLEVRTLTNLRTGVSRDNDAGPPPPPPGARRLVPDGPGDTEQRLRALEDRMDRLLREVERLRRDP